MSAFILHNADNSTLVDMLPDIVDGAIELVLLSQGPDRRITDPDDFLKSDLPGSFQLIFDEGTGYTYKPSKKSKSKKQQSKVDEAEAGNNTYSSWWFYFSSLRR